MSATLQPSFKVTGPTGNPSPAPNSHNSHNDMAAEVRPDNIGRNEATTPIPYNQSIADSPRPKKKKTYHLAEPQEYSTGQQGAFRPESRATNFSRVFSSADEKPNMRKVLFTNAPFTQYTNDRKTNVKLMLVNKVLQRPFFPAPAVFTKALGIPEDAFTFSTFTQVLQIFVQIGIICLCSQSMKNDDTEIDHSIWAYLIAQASVILAISTFFTLRVLHLGQQGTVFYSLVCSALTFTAFGIVLGVLMTKQCSNTVVYCRLRKATTGLVSLSTFIWLIELVIFATIIYISRLDVIPDPSMHVSNDFDLPGAANGRNASTATGYPPNPAGEAQNYNNASYVPGRLDTPSAIPGLPGPRTRKYVVSDTGLDEVFDESALAGLRKVEIFTDPGAAYDEK